MTGGVTSQRLQPAEGMIMAEWSADELQAITENNDLFVAPYRDDGTTYGTPLRRGHSSLTETSTCAPPAAQSRAGIRLRSRKKQDAYASPACTTTSHSKPPPLTDTHADAIDAAYEAKYTGSSAVPIMQGEGPRSATVRIAPRR